MKRKALAAIVLIILCIPHICAAAEDAKARHILRYVYIPACESCAKVKKLLTQLPERLPLQDGGEEEAPLEIESIDLTESLNLVEGLFDAYAVPEADRIVPIVFLSGSYIAGGDAILAELPAALAAGEALTNMEKGDAPSAAAAGSNGAAAFTWAGVLGAGLVAGLNPCALSMLLFLASILLSMNAKIGQTLAVFLVSKFVSYILLGTLLLNLFRAWNPSWLGFATRMLLTVVAAVLIALNLSDFVQSYRERYGKIRNQLPARTRRFLHKRIEHALRVNPKYAALSVFALGILVAFSEFLCAGQVYLATLLAGLQSGVEMPRMLMLLVGFCFAFLLPSVAVGIALARGQTMFAVSERLRANMPLIKLITALAMALIVIAAWLLVVREV